MGALCFHRAEGSALALRLLCAAGLLGASLGCYQCFISVTDSTRLCTGYYQSGQHSLSGLVLHDNVEECFNKLDVVFNAEPRVIAAARVGKGYDARLRELMAQEILPIVNEFDGKANDESVYDARLRTAADNFIAAASQLPRATGCIPPCGFQSAGAVYDCATCRYDSCELPLDCPVQELNATEGGASQMRCEVPFQLPDGAMAVWSFADKIKTLNLDHFEVVTAGTDMLFEIPTVTQEHQGTYQCEIYSDQFSIVRLYYYLSVVRLVAVGHAELQQIFQLSLLPGGRLLAPPSPDPPVLPPLLLAACLTSVLLLFFLTLGALILLLMPEKTKAKPNGEGEGSTQNLEDPPPTHRGRSQTRQPGLRGSTPGQADSSSPP